MTEPKWVSLEAIHRIHEMQIATHGGLAGVRDDGLLDSALMRPANQYLYDPENCTIASLAAAYAFGIAMNHPFIDGNKRVAFVAMYVFIRKN